MIVQKGKYEISRSSGSSPNTSSLTSKGATAGKPNATPPSRPEGRCTKQGVTGTVSSHTPPSRSLLVVDARDGRVKERVLILWATLRPLHARTLAGRAAQQPGRWNLEFDVFCLLGSFVCRSCPASREESRLSGRGSTRSTSRPGRARKDSHWRSASRARSLALDG